MKVTCFQKTDRYRIDLSGDEYALLKEVLDHGKTVFEDKAQVDLLDPAGQRIVQSERWQLAHGPLHVDEEK